MIEQRLAELGGLLSWPVLTVWIAAPAVALFWVELAKHKAKRAGSPLGDLTLIALDTTLAGLLAVLAAWGLWDWPLRQAIAHGIGVAVALPILCTVIFRQAAKLAPDLADDLGYDAIPTQYRVDDDKTEPKP